MKVLVIGSGGREHALVWKISQSEKVSKIYCVPGNAGTGQLAENVNINIDDFSAIADFVRERSVDLTVVGPEVPLSRGIADHFNKMGLRIFGPGQKASLLESSKDFSKSLMKKYSIPTAGFETFTDYDKAAAFIDSFDSGKKIVIKADGLAAGKGVIIAESKDKAKHSAKEILVDKLFGAAGSRLIVEEYLEGEEVSVQIFLDSKNYSIMVSSQDHKRVFDNDQGPNTGGMGAYAPAPVFDAQMRVKVENSVIMPIVKAFTSEGIDYQGVLYIGLMICQGVPYVLEFNCRFGDPETQVVLPLLKTDLIDIFNAVINKSLDKIHIEWYNKSVVCVVLTSGGYPGEYEKGKVISGIDSVKGSKNTVIFHAGTAKDKDGRIIAAGGRVLGVASIGDTTEQAAKLSYEAINCISFEKMHYRKDIANKALKRDGK